MRKFITFLFLFVATLTYAQTDSISQKKSLSYADYRTLESSFFVHLKRRYPTYTIGGMNTTFQKSTMPDIKIKIREHAQSFPKGIVIITGSKRSKYKDFKDIIDFLAKLKAINYSLMSRP